jgi:hypothetical protein
MVDCRPSGYTWAAMMDKCLECNSTLAKGEMACFTCGSAVRDQKKEGTSFAERFAFLVKAMFILSLVMLASSLLPLPFTPPFTKSLIATLVLLFVKSSADQMLERKRQ